MRPARGPEPEGHGTALVIREGRSPDCICDGTVPWCHVCVVTVAVGMRLQHRESLSVSMLKRRIPRLSGREAALLAEATKIVLDMRRWPDVEVIDGESWLAESAEPPQIEPLLMLPFSEAEALKAIRERPGVTRAELAEALSISVETVKTRVRMLVLAGHVHGKGSRGRVRERLYPTHDRPIGKVEPRSKVNRRQ